MDRKKWFIVITLIVIVTGGVCLSSTSNLLLLDVVPWLLIIPVITGIILGVLRVKFRSKLSIDNGQITRHGIGAFVEHWVTVFGILILIISGFLIGFLFFPHFMDTPRSIIFPLNMHFIGLIIALFGGFYFLTDYLLSRKFGKLMPNIKDIVQGTIGKYLLRKKWTAETKYLSSQKSAFLVFALLGGFQLVTGSIKIAAHFLRIPNETLAVTTAIHDIVSLLFIIMLLLHILFVILISSHRALLKSWFTGKVSKQYVEEEHTVWYEELKRATISDNDKTYMDGKD